MNAFNGNESSVLSTATRAGEHAMRGLMWLCSGLCMLGIAIPASGYAAQQVYKCTTASGVVFSPRPCGPAAKVVVTFHPHRNRRRHRSRVACCAFHGTCCARYTNRVVCAANDPIRSRNRHLSWLIPPRCRNRRAPIHCRELAQTRRSARPVRRDRGRHERTGALRRLAQRRGVDARRARTRHGIPRACGRPNRRGTRGKGCVR